MRRRRRWIALEPEIRAAMEVAAVNIRAVAEAQIGHERDEVELPQGQMVTVREVPVGCRRHLRARRARRLPVERADVLHPGSGGGGRARRARLATGPDGEVNPLVLAAAALCGVDEVYAMGGAQAIFALAHGTETIDSGRRDRRPWQRLGAGGEARRLRAGRDRLARGPLGADAGRRPRHRPRVGGAGPLRSGRARGRKPAGRGRGRGGGAGRGRGGDRAGRRASGPASATRRWPWSRSPTSAMRSTSPTPSRPSTSSCSRRTRCCSPSG